MRADFGLGFKVVSVYEERSCCWVFAPRSRFQASSDRSMVANSSLRKTYRDGMIVTAPRDTPGLFYFKDLKDAKYFIGSLGNLKIKVVRILSEPRLASTFDILSPGYLALCENKATYYIYMNRLYTHSSDIPYGSYVCKKLEVISDLSDLQRWSVAHYEDNVQG